jgi:hypothetical protein
MVYRLAAAAVLNSRGRVTPVGEAHAYLDGRSVTVCGLAISDELISFDSVRWSARPLRLSSCRICSALAR